MNGKCVRDHKALFIISLIAVNLTVTAKTRLGASAVIHGIVRFKQTPLPGAIVTAVNTTTSKTIEVVTE